MKNLINRLRFIDRMGTWALLVWLLLGVFVSSSRAVSFEDASDTLSSSTSSGVGMAVVDMDQDGFDDIVHFSNAKELLVDYQTPGGLFERKSYGLVFEDAVWGVAIGDVDGNAFPDLITGGRYLGLKLYQGEGERLFTSRDFESSIFLQGINFADIDGDGSLDIFACHDEDENVKLLNDGSGNFAENTSILYNGGYAGTYGSVWADYDNDGDADLYLSKCSVYAPNDPTDPRRINQLFRNEGDGEFTEIAAEANLAFGEQSWAADFADIDNDGDLDCFVGNHVAFSKLMRNDGDGTFTDITDSSGVREFFNLIQCVFRDFDNDGWVDLLVTGELHHLWRNNGDLTFTRVDDAFPDTTAIESCAVGDPNRDGFPDIYAGHAQIANFPRVDEPDQLFLGVPNDNHFLSVSLRGTMSNRFASGARIEAHGPWGVQVREVRSGESYGVTHSFTQTIGLGIFDLVNRLVIRWPSGIVDELSHVEADQFLILEEGSHSSLDFATVDDQRAALGTTCHTLVKMASPVLPPVTFSAENLPAGLVMDAATGLIAGTPTGAVGTQEVTIHATAGASQITESFQWEIVEVAEWVPSATADFSGTELALAARSDGEVNATLSLPSSTGNQRFDVQLSTDLSNWNDVGAPSAIAPAQNGAVAWQYEAVSKHPALNRLNYGFARYRILTPAP